MKRQTHIRLFCLRDYGLQKVSNVGPHLVESPRTLFGQRLQALHPVVVRARQSSAATASLFVVPFHGTVGIKVVFDDRNTNSASGLNRLPNFLNLLVPARPA